MATKSLKPLPLRGGVYFPTPWIWAGLHWWLALQQDAQEVMLHNFPASVSRSLRASHLTLLEHCCLSNKPRPASLKMGLHVENKRTSCLSHFFWGPRQVTGAIQDQAVMAEQPHTAWVSPRRWEANPAIIHRTWGTVNCCFRPLTSGVACDIAINNWHTSSNICLKNLYSGL